MDQARCAGAGDNDSGQMKLMRWQTAVHVLIIAESIAKRIA